MRNPAVWYSENPDLERALEHAAELRDEWMVANRGRTNRVDGAASVRSSGLAHGLRVTIGHAAIAVGRAIGGEDLVTDEAEAQDGWAKAA